MFCKRDIIVVISLVLILLMAAVSLGSISDTKHNLSADGGQATHATENTVTACSFCHVAHGAVSSDTSKYTPLWIRGNTTLPFDLYGDGITMQGTTINDPGPASLMCLACHDGSIAIGSIIMYGSGTTVPVVSSTPGLLTADGKFSPSYADATTGYSPHIGTDLTNDHPVGFQFPDAGYGAGGGRPGVGLLAQNGVLKGSVTENLYPLFGSDQGVKGFECATCHDPHLVDNGTIQTKFLRGPNQTLCQDCHNLK